MKNKPKKKGKWHLLLVGVVLGSVITVGGFLIYPSDFNRAKNSVVNKVKNFNWGFGKSTTKEESIEKKNQTKTSPIEKYTETTKHQPGKTFWDWLQLGAVPLVIAILGLWFQQRENKRAEEQDNREREIAQGNLAEEAIRNYLDNMAKLLLDKEFRKELLPNVNDKLNPSGYENPVRDVARTQTITILRRLEGDKKRQGRIITFLKDAGLYRFILKKAHLSEINLSEAYLSTNLQRADLRGANLQDADLKGANLQDAVLLDAKNLTRKQIKSACNWDKAIYKGEWHWEEETETWVANNEQDEQKNLNYIKDLKKDKKTDPTRKPDCSRWSR
jgi:uncharacterized protein YjbI with pentapeptide repeats